MKAFRQLRLKLIAPDGSEKLIVILPKKAPRWRPYAVRECVRKFEDRLKDRWPAFRLRVVKVGESQYNFVFEPRPVAELLATAREAIVQ